MSYPGGKSHCYQQLINLIPPHRVYIETHLGGGAVLRHKHPAEINIGIDRDASVIKKSAGKFDTGFRFIAAPAEQWLLDYRFVGDEFVYADPPYLRHTRRATRSPYRYDYTDEEHARLLAILGNLPCRIMISGYRSALYQQLLPDWNVRDFEVGSRTGRRLETVWLNYDPGAVHDTRYLGSTFRERQTIKRRCQRWTRRFRNEPWPVQQALLAEMTRAFMEHSHIPSTATRTPRPAHQRARAQRFSEFSQPSLLPENAN